MNTKEFTITPQESAQLARQDRANSDAAFVQLIFFVIVGVLVISALTALVARLRRFVAEQSIAVQEKRAALPKAQLVYANSDGLLPVPLAQLQTISADLLMAHYVEQAKKVKYPTMLENLHVHHAPVTHTVTQSRTDNDLNMNGSGQLPQLVTGQPAFDLLPNSQSGMKLLPVTERLPVATKTTVEVEE